MSKRHRRSSSMIPRRPGHFSVPFFTDVDLDRKVRTVRDHALLVIDGTYALGKLSGTLKAVGLAVGVATNIAQLRQAMKGYDTRIAAEFTEFSRFNRQLGEIIDPDFARAVGGFVEAIQKLLTGQDDGESLRAVVSESSSDPLRAAIKAMKEHIAGRDEGPDPVTEFILVEAEKIRKLHGCTDGETCERLVNNLKALPEVKQAIASWGPLDKRKNIKGLSVTVQAYDRLVPPGGPRDRREAGRWLSNMRQNHREWLVTRNISSDQNTPLDDISSQ